MVLALVRVAAKLGFRSAVSIFARAFVLPDSALALGDSFVNAVQPRYACAGRKDAESSIEAEVATDAA